MATLKLATFVDLFSQAAGATHATIECAVKRQVVRKLRLDGDSIVLDALSGPLVRVARTEAIVYEPWVFDRGSLLFNCRQLGMPDAKLCTEFDELVYPDGRRFQLVPADPEVN